nr:immunoglobulin heavy chain junction region [Macaca mulatta]MOX38242.1 immunoglobulin heavy chain junction region [Macaca mulatta]MOX38910.1 immunoglobulin heavy chain junction region [Macaca mulatta]MOX39749.1 immunoglobulin heavy chain junction region [Macaca mulatta]MOX40593.1 immunoglobulin heavy chain junction region [Macaca mulatta]
CCSDSPPYYYGSDYYQGYYFDYW